MPNHFNKRQVKIRSTSCMLGPDKGYNENDFHPIPSTQTRYILKENDDKIVQPDKGCLEDKNSRQLSFSLPITFNLSLLSNPYSPLLTTEIVNDTTLVSETLVQKQSHSSKLNNKPSQARNNNAATVNSLERSNLYSVLDDTSTDSDSDSENKMTSPKLESSTRNVLSNESAAIAFNNSLNDSGNWETTKKKPRGKSERKSLIPSKLSVPISPTTEEEGLLDELQYLEEDAAASRIWGRNTKSNRFKAAQKRGFAIARRNAQREAS